MIGTVLLGFVLLFALSAVFFDAKGSDCGSRISAILAGLAAVGASAVLFAVILSNDFSYSYVASYSSIDLPLIYKISAFWAGQQGSFLLWLLIHALVGTYMVCHQPSDGDGGGLIYHLLTAMLVILVFIKSPFTPAEHIMPDGVRDEPAAAGSVDGRASADHLYRLCAPRRSLCILA